MLENVDSRSLDADELSGTVVSERKTTKKTPHQASGDTLGHATIENREPHPRPGCDPPPAKLMLLHNARRRAKEVSHDDLATGLGGVGAKKTMKKHSLRKGRGLHGRKGESNT